MTSTSTDGLPPATDESALYDAPSHRRDDHPQLTQLQQVGQVSRHDLIHLGAAALARLWTGRSSSKMGGEWAGEASRRSAAEPGWVVAVRSSTCCQAAGSRVTL